jgi:hypothetical protein
MAFEQDGRHAVDLIEATPHLRLESRWTQEIDTTPVRRVVLMPDASVADLAVVAADLAVDAAQREQESYYRALEEAAQRAEIAARAAQRSADRDTVQSAHSSD